MNDKEMNLEIFYLGLKIH